MPRKIKIIFLIAIIFRIFLSAITYHSDVVPFAFAGRVIKEGNVTNFYDYLWRLPDDSPVLKVYPRNLFNYPPMVYFSLGGASLIFTSLIPENIVHQFIYDYPSLIGNIELNILLILLKLPYLIFDLASALILMSFVKKERNKILIALLWLFNPVNLYATYMMGMYEIIPTFFVLASIYVLKKNPKKLLFSALLLGIGATFKIFPILFLVPLMSLTNSWKERIKILLAGVGVYILTILPFISSYGFRSTALVASQTTKSLYLQLPISGGEAILPFLALLVFFYMFFIFKKVNVNALWERYFIILILFFMLTHYHPQWFLWITPFFVQDLIHTKFRHWPLVLIALFSFFGLVTFFDPGLSIGLFSPISSALYRTLGIWDSINIDVNFARSVLQTIFVGVGIYYIYYYLSPSTKNEI